MALASNSTAIRNPNIIAASTESPWEPGSVVCEVGLTNIPASPPLRRHAATWATSKLWASAGGESALPKRGQPTKTTALWIRRIGPSIPSLRPAPSPGPVPSRTGGWGRLNLRSEPCRAALAPTRRASAGRPAWAAACVGSSLARALSASPCTRLRKSVLEGGGKTLETANNRVRI